MKYNLKDENGIVVNTIEIDEAKQQTEEAYVPPSGYSLEIFIQDLTPPESSI